MKGWIILKAASSRRWAKRPATRVSSAPFSSENANSSLSPSDDNGHCQLLQQALPKLQSRFAKLSDNNGGDFPILAPAIREQLHKRWQPDEFEKRASVLVSLYSDQGVPSVLFTSRSQNVPQNPSEISFPGGHYQQESDESLEDTALRETQEELMGSYPWKDPNHLVILGRGTTIPAITGTPVTPVIAVMMQEIRQPVREVFPGDNFEVEHVFGMPLLQLLQVEESHELPDHRLLGEERQGPRYPSPYGNIWGLTAFMLKPLLHKLYRPVFNLKK